MIYLVTTNLQLEHPAYTIISVAKSFEILSLWKVAQADSETTGLNPHINDLLCFQLGTKQDQIVIDCTTIDILLYKDYLEKTPLILHNGKFDLQFLYSKGIVPWLIYDTMIAEQVLYMGWPMLTVSNSEYLEKGYTWPYRHIMGYDSRTLSFALSAICKEYLNIDIDKSIRSEINTLGLTPEVIVYAANDVVYLSEIKEKQEERARQEGSFNAIWLENGFVPVIAYMEWCGVKLDENRWKIKMSKDKTNLEQALHDLNEFVINTPQLAQFTYWERQGDLFNGFDTKPRVNVNWNSSEQVNEIAKILGFNTAVTDKATGNTKESVLEKVLKVQKGICDEFLNLYFNYQGYAKVVSSFGQGHLNAINPITGRLHTAFHQLGASSGRLSCGGGIDSDLEKLKGLPKGSCKYLNLQQLPHDPETRACFVAEPGNLWCSCDFSAEEARLTADVSGDREYYKEFTERTGDTHAMFAWACYEKECRALGCTSAMDVKSKAKKWRDAVKSAEFAYTFSASADTIARTAGIPLETAQKMVTNLDNFFSGLTQFKKEAAEKVKKLGYIVICPLTGHKLYWWDHDQWIKDQESYTPEFWEDYKINHKGVLNDPIAQKVRNHFQAADKYSKLALNSLTQGRGAIIFKESGIKLFKWIREHNCFGKIKICVGVHDEWNVEYPAEYVQFPQIMSTIMEESAAKYCKSLPIPAQPEIGDCWIH